MVSLDSSVGAGAEGGARETVFVAALTGWMSDAGCATSGVAQLLMDRYECRQVESLCACAYYELGANRPMVYTVGGERRLMWPQSTIVRVEVSPALEIVLLSGTEPDLSWEGYANTCLDVAQRCGCTRVVTLGSMLADCPHTRVLPMNEWHTARRADGSLAMASNNAPDEYHGAASMGSVLGIMAADRGIPADSFVVSVPSYMERSECPQAMLDLLRMLEGVTGDGLDEGDLEARARAWHAEGDGMVRRDPVLAARVEEMERHQDRVYQRHMELRLSLHPEACSQLVSETEQFLVDIQLHKGAGSPCHGGGFLEAIAHVQPCGEAPSPADGAPSADGGGDAPSDAPAAS